MSKCESNIIVQTRLNFPEQQLILKTFLLIELKI